MRSRFLAWAPAEMSNTVGSEVGKEEEAQFGTESEVPWGI